MQGSQVSNSGMKTIYSSIRISTLGELKVCWWDGVATSDTTSSYRTSIGTLVIRGPTLTGIRGHIYIFSYVLEKY